MLQSLDILTLFADNIVMYLSFVIIHGIRLKQKAVTARSLQ